LKKLIPFAFVVFLATDLFSPPQKQLSARAAEYGIYAYQATYGRLLSRLHVVHCKFKPSCSNYALLAFQKYGALKGSALTAGRLMRCSPLSSDHGTDLP
jgi:uncharacterized protein